MSFYRCSLVFLLVSCAVAPAQPRRPGKGETDPNRYPAIPFNSKDVEALFKNQLEGARDRDFARDFLNQILKNKDRISLPPGLDLNDPALLERVKPLVKDLKIEKAIKDLTPEERGKLAERLKELAPGKVPGPEGGRPPEAPGADPDPDSSKVPLHNYDPPNSKPAWLSEEKFKQAFENWMQGESGGRFADWLRDSPAWKNTLSELQKQLPDLDVELPANWSLDSKFLEGDWLGKSWDQVSSLPTPSLPAVRLPSLNLGPGRGPAFGGPGGVSTGAVQGILWMVLGAILLGVLWYGVRQYRAVPPPAFAAGLGPWPVDPAHISTRAQLRQAFDYLALLRLGSQAETWNHRRIAAALDGKSGGAASYQDAVRALAHLYERARYTAGPEELSPAEQAAVRANLGLLV